MLGRDGAESTTQAYATGIALFLSWLALRERLGPLGQRLAVATSGSKGLHLYVPMDDPITST
jgi:DNA primase